MQFPGRRIRKDFYFDQDIERNQNKFFLVFGDINHVYTCIYQQYNQHVNKSHAVYFCTKDKWRIPGYILWSFICMWDLICRTWEISAREPVFIKREFVSVPLLRAASKRCRISCRHWFQVFQVAGIVNSKLKLRTQCKWIVERRFLFRV